MNAKQDDEKKKTTWIDVANELVKKSSDPLGKILDFIAVALQGRPEEIRAELEVSRMITIGVFVIVLAVLIITGALAYVGKLSGDAVAFVFGTAFGSLLTFLYRYLKPREEEG